MVLGLATIAACAVSPTSLPPAPAPLVLAPAPEAAASAGSPTPAPRSTTPTPVPTIDPRATVGPSDDFVLYSFPLVIAASKKFSPVGSAIRLTAEKYGSGMGVGGKVGWTIDPATAANARVVDLDNGELGSPADVVITGPGPVRVRAKYGTSSAEILLAGTTAPPPGTQFAWLGFSSPRVPGVFVIVTNEDWDRYHDLQNPGTGLDSSAFVKNVPPVDLSKTSLVVLAARCAPAWDCLPVLTQVDPTPPGLVEVVETHQEHLAPPPSSGRGYHVIFQVAKLPVGSRIRLVCDEPGCGLTQPAQ